MAIQLNTASPPNHIPSSTNEPVAGVGTGILYVYTDSARTSETTENTPGNYMVFPATTYYFRITGIAEYSIDTTINIWASYESTNELVYTGPVQIGGTIDFEWSIPTLPIDTSIKVKYGTSLTGPNPTGTSPKKKFVHPQD